MHVSEQKYTDRYNMVIDALVEIIKLQLENTAKEGGQNHDNEESCGGS